MAWWPKNFFFFLRNLLFKRIHLHATLKLHARHQFIVDSHKNFFNRKSKRQRPQAASGRKSISKQDSQTRFENPEAKKIFWSPEKIKDKTRFDSKQNITSADNKKAHRRQKPAFSRHSQFQKNSFPQTGEAKYFL